MPAAFQHLAPAMRAHDRLDEGAVNSRRRSPQTSVWRYNLLARSVASDLERDGHCQSLVVRGRSQPRHAAFRSAARLFSSPTTELNPSIRAAEYPLYRRNEKGEPNDGD